VDKYKFKPTEKTFLNLSYTHKTRRIVNKECMERYITENNCKTIFVEMDKLNPKTQDVKLAKRMPIIAHTTNKKLGFMNSQTFTIEEVNNKSLTIKSDTEIITINTKDFHKFFYLGFCITVHSSQGETFDNKYTIHDWYKLCEKAKYVALSRGTKIQNIQIA
jgi:ATP-dependent exoDNAse (exonuclease V) alpha subunit